MANVKKANRVQDTDIKRLNHVGLGLKAIADLLGCHAATITLRLKAMGIEPTDTRRSFMEGVFDSLSAAEQDWLSHNLFNAGIGIKEFIVKLIQEAYKNAGADAVAVVPVAMPPMQSAVTQPMPTEPLKVEETPKPEVKAAPDKVVDQPGEPTTNVPPPAPPKSLFG